ncbi:helix-turn-helix domain-containing protein [Flavobacterium sp.]|uniref:helix-turn-helix domain-containing protein n=1 Tax=Flavobacterium sp. TaxID=239 RepID=UPI002B4AC8C8|nr:helix-turn-helix domain-containing protein [Flavobacterium sp.]HLP64264.1 helix-turn-helix domain-containing protein [Flavobacterium sp.]
MNTVNVQNIDINQFKDIIVSIIKEQLDGIYEALKKKDDETLLTREETFRFLKIDSTTLWYWTKEGKLKCYGIGNKRYYKKSEVLECLTLLKN